MVKSENELSCHFFWICPWWWWYDDDMMMIWWWYDDDMMMICLWYDDNMMLIWWWYDDAMMMIWWRRSTVVVTAHSRAAARQGGDSESVDLHATKLLIISKTILMMIIIMVIMVMLVMQSQTLVQNHSNIMRRRKLQLCKTIPKHDIIIKWLCDTNYNCFHQCHRHRHHALKR